MSKSHEANIRGEQEDFSYGDGRVLHLSSGDGYRSLYGIKIA